MLQTASCTIALKRCLLLAGISFWSPFSIHLRKVQPVYHWWWQHHIITPPNLCRCLSRTGSLCQWPSRRLICQVHPVSLISSENLWEISLKILWPIIDASWGLWFNFSHFANSLKDLEVSCLIRCVAIAPQHRDLFNSAGSFWKTFGNFVTVDCLFFHRFCLQQKNCLITIHTVLPNNYAHTVQLLIPFSDFLSDGRSIPGHWVIEVTTCTHDGVHAICLHPASGPQPSGQSNQTNCLNYIVNFLYFLTRWLVLFYFFYL